MSNLIDIQLVQPRLLHSLVFNVSKAIKMLPIINRPGTKTHCIFDITIGKTTKIDWQAPL